VPRLLMRRLLGRRLPLTDGHVKVAGIEDAVSIRRDKWGIPHIEASNDRDAWFGVGFCHGQDRTFQLETLLRVVRGTLSELVGKDGLAMDRLSRRIGFARQADRQLGRLQPDIQEVFHAYARGVTAGGTAGLPQRPHEFALLFSHPTPWQATDVVGIVRLQSFLFATNADAELARLKILLAEGPEVLAALDPSLGEAVPEGVPVTEPGVSPVLDCLSQDLKEFAHVLSPGGASNSWCVSSRRTSTGRPLLSNDPHLPPVLPAPLYLVHVTTPEWAMAGATLVGGPAVVAGHNGFAAWGLTAALFDNTDLFQEEIGKDGCSVRSGDDFAPCEVIHERIDVRRGKPVTERVVITPRGPIVGPALTGEMGALSLRVFWLDNLPFEGFLRTHRARSFDEFRRPFASWQAPAFNLTYADQEGNIGWQLIGAVPIRRKGWGTIPLPGWDPDVGWEPDPAPFDEMPYVLNPEDGFLATANTRPYPQVDKPFLGVDWIDEYRLWRILELLGGRTDWDVASSQAMQLDQLSLSWRDDIRDVVLAAKSSDADSATAHEMLTRWDGRVTPESPEATVFEFFVAEMAHRVAAAKAPRSARWVLGQGFAQLLPSTTFSFRRVGHLVKLLRSRPEGWFDRPWEEEIADALGAVIRNLKSRWGEDPDGWQWGRARPLILRHPVGDKKPMDQVFNIGPIHIGGDSDTIAQASLDPTNPVADPAFIAGLRMVIDVGNWEASRFALPAGQSGNPMSPHYDDQVPLWESGQGLPIAWSPEEVDKATVAKLTLSPRGQAIR
jgi:penicillin amidase